MKPASLQLGLVTCLISFVAGACTGDGANGGDDTSETGWTPASLVEPQRWVPATVDPLPSHRPAELDCAIGYGVEDGVFEANTDDCNYGSFEQASLVDVIAGDTLELSMVHEDLFAEEPANAHIALFIGGESAWETTLPIPMAAAAHTPSWTADGDAPAGTPIHFHVHNHGVNSYRLLDVRVAER